MYIRKGLKLSDEEIKDLSDAWRKLEEWAEIEYKKRSQVRLLKGHLRHKLNNRSTRIVPIKGCYKKINTVECSKRSLVKTDIEKI